MIPWIELYFHIFRTNFIPFFFFSFVNLFVVNLDFERAFVFNNNFKFAWIFYIPVTVKCCGGLIFESFRNRTCIIELVCIYYFVIVSWIFENGSPREVVFLAFKNHSKRSALFFHFVSADQWLFGDVWSHIVYTELTWLERWLHLPSLDRANCWINTLKFTICLLNLSKFKIRWTSLSF